MAIYDTEKWKGIYRDAAQEMVPDEQVEAAWMFYRTGGFAGLALGPLSPLAAIVARTIGKKRAAGFPNTFVVALTPSKVYAFKCKPRAMKIRIGKELAVWDRSALQVTAEDAALNIKVTIESPAEGEKVVCSTGRDATSREFVDLLTQPAGAAPAPSPA